MSQDSYDIAVIGAGPAGASAAVFLARAKLRTLVIDDDRGMTRQAHVNNHLGLPEGIRGPELVERGLAHAARAGAVHTKAKVTAVARDGDAFVVALGEGTSVRATHVLLALGANPTLGKAAGASSKPGVEPYIKEVLVVDALGRTTVPGLWAAGVCAGTSVHTIVTAGDGARVAIELLSALRGERYVDHDSL